MIFIYNHPVLTSDLDSSHSFLIFFRIDIDWRLNYDGFMTMYGFPSTQGNFRLMWLLGFPDPHGFRPRAPRDP